MCNVKSDCQIFPAVFLIQNGPFHILGGNPDHPKAEEILSLIPCGSTILPSPSEWISKLKKQKDITLQKYDRFSLDHNNISITYLNKIIAESSNQLNVKRIDESLASVIYQNEDFQYHFQNFKSESDFLNRGLGYVVLREGLIIGVASSALVCSSGYEINIMVLPEYRGKSLGKLLAANLVRSILTSCKIPHWDAANEISLNLAEQLGYDFKGKYQAYRVKNITRK
jgi:GNAT superfamily N-acetyltransferase